MATVRSQEASSSTSPCPYHVFLSFRGEDTGKTFTGHLYKALVDAGFRTFRGNDEIERGENSKSKLEKAIQQSRSSIIVFSENYASSEWCLDELVMIVNHQKTSRHAVLPVFYHVDPSDVRKQTGGFAKKFANHEEEFKAETGKRKKEQRKRVKGWRAALKEVGNLAGMVLENQANGYEARFIQNIVEDIGNKLNRTVLSVAPYPVGIESRVRDINFWVKERSFGVGVGVAVICGMGGVGKTNIAKRVYNQNFESFEGSSFLANIREASEQIKGLVRLQRQLISDILNGRREKIYHVDEGITKIKDAICCKRILLVLDDVDQMNQVSVLLGTLDWLCTGSKIIITTRREGLLQKVYKSIQMFKVEILNDDESLRLFSWHAFGQDHPTECYKAHSKKFVQRCGGIPLALQVLGSSLFGNSVGVWESALNKMESIFDSNILKVLKISYDSLDDHDKYLFLDIVCFFVGKDRNFTVKILDECDFCTTVGISNLLNRCLITINRQNKLTIHQLLQDMGREVIRQESPREPGRRSRVWRHKDALEILREKTGTETIQGLLLNLPMLKEDSSAKTLINANARKRKPEDLLSKSTPDSEGSPLKRRRLSSFSWQSIHSALTESSSTANEIDLETNAFSRMRNIKLLQLNYVRLSGGYKEFPTKLRWLCWRGFPLNCIPSNFFMENIVALDMRNSNLIQAWKGAKILRLLKILNLSHSHDLTNTPNFSGVPFLEKLILKDCINLVEVHESIELLGSLVFLNLKGCTKLRKLPRRFNQLKSLKELTLSGCSMLGELPRELGKMESLTVICGDGNTINELPSAMGHLQIVYRFLNSSFWSWVSPPKSPKSTGFSLEFLPSSITELSLGNCHITDDVMPIDVSSLSSLKNLNLGGNPLSSLPGSVKNLTMLKSICLDTCPRLQSLSELPLNLKYLFANNCKSLVRIENIPKASSITLSLDGCDQLVEIPSFFILEPLENFGAKVTNNLGLIDFQSMGNMEVELFNRLTGTRKRSLIQGLYEFGIFSTFFPGWKVPDWFSIKSRGLDAIYFVVNAKIRSLSFCLVYAHDGHSYERKRNHGPVFVGVKNKRKNVTWNYSPTFTAMPGANLHMIWLSHWNFGNKFECGDEVEVEFGMTRDTKKVEVGVHAIYAAADEIEEIQSKGKEIIQHGMNPTLNVRIVHYLNNFAHMKFEIDYPDRKFFRLPLNFGTDPLLSGSRNIPSQQTWESKALIFGQVEPGFAEYSSGYW